MEQEELVGEWTSPPEGGGLPIEDSDYIEQVRKNCRLELPNMQYALPHDKIMIMVCGGPTAQLFLEDIRKKGEDDKYRIFCSNKTHDWLIENGIIPDYMFIIDPKKSKIKDVQHPHKDVEYLIGTCCNPGVFEALKGYKLTRLMVFSGSYYEGIGDINIIQTLYGKTGYAPLEGGTMAGLRAIPLASLLGYQTIEFYGFDSCFFNYDKDGNPIYYSYDKKRLENIMECKTDDGRVFESTPVFASQARQFIKWKNKFEWLKMIIHGDSLTAHIDKLDEESRKPKHNLLITDYYLKLNQEMHKEKLFDGTPGFGVSGHEYAGEIAILSGQLAKKFGEITVLDYGCGQGTLKKMLPNIVGVIVKEFDPCIPDKSTTPESADLVICTDVLEHIEGECLENVLDDLKRVVKKELFVSICLLKANKYYSDGQNTHLCLLPEDIWYSKLRKRFDVIEMKRTPTNLVYVLQKKGEK